AGRLCRLTIASRGAGRHTEKGRVLAEVDRDPVESRADPDDLAGRAQLAELRGPITGHAARKHLGLPKTHRQRKGLQRNQSFAKRSSAVDSLPARQEACERRLLGGLDLLTQRGE